MQEDSQMSWKEECSKHLGAMDRTEQERMYSMMMHLFEMIRSSIPYNADPMFERIWKQVKEEV